MRVTYVRAKVHKGDIQKAEKIRAKDSKGRRFKRAKIQKGEEIKRAKIHKGDIQKAEKIRALVQKGEDSKGRRFKRAKIQKGEDSNGRRFKRAKIQQGRRRFHNNYRLLLEKWKLNFNEKLVLISILPAAHIKI